MAVVDQVTDGSTVMVHSLSLGARDATRVIDARCRNDRVR